MSTAAPALRTPWTLRLFQGAPLHPLLTGLALGLGWFGLYLAFAQAFGLAEDARYGGQPLLLSVSFWFELLQALLLAWAPTAAAIATRGAVRDLRNLAPALEAPADAAELERRLLHVPPRTLAVARALLVAGGLALAINPGGWVGGRPGWTEPLLFWALLRSVVTFWLYAHPVVFELRAAALFSEIGERHVRVDLLDLTPLSPFARHGLRSVLLWVVLTSLISLLLFVPWSIAPALLMLALMPGFALALLLLPVQGVHRRLVAERAAELARVRNAARDERGRLLGTAPGATGRLAELLAWETRIAAVPSWPFDVPMLLRFALYVAVGLGSWLGAALVERGLGAMIG